MDIEKLELFDLLKKISKKELLQIMTIMICWDEMVEIGIVNDYDINLLANLSEEKQKAIIKFVSNKLEEQMERNNNGKEKEKLWYISLSAYE